MIKRAHRIRKMTGGGMRQAGILAAAGSYALDHHVARLADDHALAARLAQGLQGLPGVWVEPVQTNMVFVALRGLAKTRAGDLLPYLKAHCVLAQGRYRLRFHRFELATRGFDFAKKVVGARDFGPRMGMFRIDCEYALQGEDGFGAATGVQRSDAEQVVEFRFAGPLVF